MMLRIVLLAIALFALPASAQTTWHIGNDNKTGGHAVKVLGNPRIVSTPHG